MNCTRCEGSGFLNLHQVDLETADRFSVSGDPEIILHWIDCNSNHDVSVCDCCGDGTTWYGLPGQHNLNDPSEPFPECY